MIGRADAVDVVGIESARPAVGGAGTRITRHEGHQGAGIATGTGKLREQRIVHRRVQRGRIRVDLQRLGRNFHRLLDLTGLQTDVDADQFGRLDQHPGAIELLEALHLCAQSVLAPLQELERVLARFVRDCLEFDARLHVAQSDPGRRNDAPRRIQHGSAKGPRIALGVDASAQKTQERHAKKGPESAGIPKAANGPGARHKTPPLNAIGHYGNGEIKARFSASLTASEVGYHQLRGVVNGYFDGDFHAVRRAVAHALGHIRSSVRATRRAIVKPELGARPSGREGGS